MNFWDKHQFPHLWNKIISVPWSLQELNDVKHMQASSITETQLYSEVYNEFKDSFCLFPSIMFIRYPLIEQGTIVRDHIFPKTILDSFPFPFCKTLSIQLIICYSSPLSEFSKEIIL